MDESTAEDFHSFLDIVWNAAVQIDTKELIDQMNERIRVKAAKDLAKG